MDEYPPTMPALSITSISALTDDVEDEVAVEAVSEKPKSNMDAEQAETIAITNVTVNIHSRLRLLGEWLLLLSPLSDSQTEVPESFIPTIVPSATINNRSRRRLPPKCQSFAMQLSLSHIKIVEPF